MPFAGISGTVTSTDAHLVYNVSANATVSGTSPAGFSSVAYQLFTNNNPILTFDSASTLNATLGLAGTGTVVLNGMITTTDAGALQSQSVQGATGYAFNATDLAITNNGTVTTTRTDPQSTVTSAVSLGTADTLINNGTITMVDNAGNALANEAAVTGGTAITNNGTITGTGVGAVNLVSYSYGNAKPVLTNTGILTSDQTTVIVFGNPAIINSGTITSTGGVAIGNPPASNYYQTVADAQVTNLTGGVISGAGAAIAMQGGTVNNAGTINGNVNLAYSPYGYPVYTPGDYIANGGTLNGNLTLDNADALVIALGNEGTGPLGGINGTIYANGAALVYTLNANATTTTTSPPAGFATLGYVLSDNPTLTFSSASNLAGTLGLAGNGTVIFNGTVISNDAPALQLQPPALVGLTGSSTNALTITNNGTITTTADYSASSAITVALTNADTLVNNGAITLVNTGYVSASYAAVSGSPAITNTGTIAATGASAIAIGSYTGGTNSEATLVNSGSITSDQNAVFLTYSAFINNSGTITSTGMAAIAGNASFYYGNPSQVMNLAGGIISGNGDAIDLQAGTVSNAGTINGNVNLAYSPYGYPDYSSAIYIDNGGTLNGNLTLGAYDALEINLANAGTGPLGGVSGTIAANGAALIYTVSANATTTPSAPSSTSGFGTQGYLLSNNATLTFSAASTINATLGVAGTGSVIFNGSLTSNDAPALQAQPQALLVAGGIASANNALTITNNGTIAATADANGYAPAAVILSGADTLINNGSISLVNTGTPAPGAFAVSSGQAIANTGSITATGASGISLGYFYSNAVATLTNSDTISSDQSAIVVMSSANITNSGSISGTGIAVDGTPTSSAIVTETLTNSGTITGGTNALIVGSTATVSNSGTISSGGTAILGLGTNYNAAVQITNLAGGVISGVGDAILLPGGIVNNAGTINGNVDLTYAPYGYQANLPGTYFANGGTLNGNLTLNSEDALVINLGAAANTPLGGVTGMINANGATLVYNVNTDTAISSTTLPAGFGTLTYQLSNNPTLTVAGGTTLTTTLGLAGSGSVIVNGSITTTDQSALQSQPAVLLSGNYAPNALAITNNGTISTTNDVVNYNIPAAVSLGSGDTLVNNGTIALTNTSGGIGIYSAAVAGGLSVTNTGTITGAGVNAITVGTYTGGPAETLTNSGTITADQFGALVSSAANIINSGTIASTGTAAISTGYYYLYNTTPQITNLAGGVITGFGDAIDTAGGTVSNAGTINGNVNLAYSSYGYLSYAPGSYIANGGTLNGNLTLGPDQALVLNLGAAGSGPPGGITGTINANGAALIYNVSADATIATTPALPAGFGSLGYQLATDPTLTLGSGIALTTTLGLAGTGAVILNGAVATTNQTALQSQAVIAASATTTPNALVITNNGTIATTFDNYNYFYSVAAVTLQAGDTLVNNGAISLTNSSGSPDPSQSAVSGGLSVTNTGTIMGAGVSAIQAGIFDSTITGNVTNSGTASSDQYAVFVAGPATITNSGTIASTGMAAIGNAIAYSPPFSGNLGITVQVTNLASGIITGVGDAIDLNGGSVSNAGTINGNVNLAYSAYGSPALALGAYFANGGTLNGNLTLGEVGVLVVNLASMGSGPFAGVTGTINTNGGSLVYDVSADATTTAALPSGYSAVVYQLADNATLTLGSASAMTTALNLAGSGSVIFNGTIATTDVAGVISQPLLTPAGFSTTANALNITNNGAIATAFDGSTASYAFQASAVSLGRSDTLINAGTIAFVDTAASPYTNASAVFGGQSITNSGSITSTGAPAILNLESDSTVTNLSGGIISSNGDAIDLAGGTVSNAGTINGNVNLAYAPDGVAILAAGAYIQNGGMLNGNLSLGAGQTLVTDLATSGNGSFGGISGTVTASNSSLVYNVNATTTTTATLPAGFISLGYQLSGDPVLTLTAASDLTSSLGLAGTGTVIFDGTIATTDAAALRSQPLLTASGASSAPNALAITNNGAIAATFDAASTTATPSAVTLGSGDVLVNNATIAASVTSPSPNFAAVTGGQQVTNAGTITATGLSAVCLGIAGSPAGAALVLTNSGTITSDQYGAVLNGPGSILNSGTINGVEGALVAAGATAIVNSGTIASNAGTAILSPGPGATQLINAAGGAITGASDAVDIAGGLVMNAGTITGNVDLGYAASNAPANASPAIYFAVGGTLAGNLTFASTGGGNELIESGAGFGVTGTITGGPGANYLGHLRNASGTVTLTPLPSGFSSEFTVAQGASTQITIQGPAGNGENIYVGGNGTIINQANTSGVIENLGASGESYFTSQGLQLSALTNQATVGGIAITTANLVNSGTVGLPGNTAPVIVQTTSAPLSFTNSGTIDGGIVIGAAHYTVVDAVGGSITGSITIQPMLAGGSASGSITLAGGFAGSIEGGAGATTSLAVSGGSAAQPITFGTIADVASYTQSGGYAVLGGAANLGTAATIAGGTFVGLLGSTLTAAQVNVAAGASFASGGTINGNLAVSGALHVGASPDTMTVNGNVALASGSTSVFEVSPTASSKLVASGSVTIAANTTLQIVPLRPIAPGTSIDLINAAGGISGDFTTLTGFDGTLIEKNNQLSLLALFDTGQAANPQVAHGIAYLNALLVSGKASPALLAALPALQPAGGSPSTPAFARVTPEAYATATQIGVENALVVSRAVRDLGWDKALHSGNLFTFGEALGNWRGLGGNGALGISHADLSGYGFIGGLGVGSHTASLAAFGGYLDQSESISELAASTKTKGFVGGLTGRLASGPALFNLSVIYDDSHANTSRLSPDAVALSSGYTLHGWTVDGEASTSIALGTEWSVHPHVGATWVWTQRGGTVEAGASAFALTVAGDHDHAGFVDGGVRFASPRGDVGQFSPFLDIGVRYQVEGRATDAIAGLDGGPVALTGYGVRRRRAGATAESGVTWRATQAVSLFVNGSGELSRGDSSGSVTGGVSVRF